MIAIGTELDPLHNWLWSSINNRLAPWWPRLFGYHLVAVGEQALQLDFSGSPIRHHCLIAASGQVNARPDALPLPENSVDVVVLPFTLHHAEDPHQVMREAYRVLIAGGHLVIIQPNPLSPAAIGGRLGSRRRDPLWQGQWLTSWRWRDWLSLLACDVRHRDHLCFGSLFGSQPPPARWEELAGRHLPWLGGVELVIACKSEIPLTLVRQPARRKIASPRPALAPQVRMPTPRS